MMCCAATTLDLGQRVHVMGILNVTPDSFSDGGQLANKETLLQRAENMIAAGADILDIGGESTRPFAAKVELDEELNRVIPAIESIRHHFSTPISIDTTKAAVAEKALEAGADIINDVSALRLDSQMIEVAKKHNAPVILMHMQGQPGDMQKKPCYDDVISDILSFLQERLDWAEKKGLDRSRMIIDPGIGFGKTLEHNLTILKHLDQFSALGVPLLLGHSRKAFIGTILQLDDPGQRDCATAAIAALAVMAGVSIIRVHDVKKTVQAVRLAEAIKDAG
ncbi:MAG: dihydropteroate synthase [Desulfobulbaceae bacterium]|nr:dihydropteroate synthase [Desulfobulbaceae bacterium]